eukprot:2368018-Lingulodinium_polyedra.AAC.1
MGPWPPQRPLSAQGCAQGVPSRRAAPKVLRRAGQCARRSCRAARFEVKVFCRAGRCARPGAQGAA